MSADQNPFSQQLTSGGKKKPRPKRPESKKGGFGDLRDVGHNKNGGYHATSIKKIAILMGTIRL
jgi:hypothetical protein